MPQSQREAEKAVYDALCVVFNEISDKTGKKELKARIQDHATDPGLAHVIQAFGLGHVKGTAASLHKKSVFSSKNIAQQYFKAVTQVAEGSPDAAHLDAAPCAASHVDSAPCDASHPNAGPCDAEAHTHTPADKEIQLSAKTSVPLSAQHHVLVKVQFELEAACFEFARAKIPVILQQNDWTCVEAAELNLIARALSKHQEHLSGVAGLPEGATAGKLLGTMERIRHAAVHRQYLEAKELLAMLRDGERLLILLESERRLASMRSLREEVSKCIFELNDDEMDVQKSIVTVHNVAAMQIARLRQQEDEAVAQAEARRAAHLSSSAQKITAAVSNVQAKEATQIRQPSLGAALSTILFFLARSMRSALLLVFDILCRLFAGLARIVLRVSAAAN